MEPAAAPDETAAARILDLLGAAGVRTAFGLPGVHNLPFWRCSTGGGRPRILPVRHEQTAGYAADGLARATGGLGVALTTTGPGAANALAAFGEASAVHSPLLLVASEVPLRVRRAGIGRGALHEMPDQSALFSPAGKGRLQRHRSGRGGRDGGRRRRWSHGRPRPGRSTSACLRTSSAQPRRLARWSGRLGRTAPELRAVEAAAALLSSAARVVIWAGGGCVASGAEQAVTDLAWRLGAPVVTTYAARGLLGVDHPLLVDAPPHEPLVSALIAEADLLLVVGSQLDGMTTRNWTMPRPPLLLRIDVDERTAHQGWAPDGVVVGDAALVCDALATRVAPREPWGDQVFRVRHDVRAGVAADPRTTEASELLDSVEQGWPAGGDVVCDMAVAGYWVGGYAAQPRSRRLQYPVGWGTLGYALPGRRGGGGGFWAGDARRSRRRWRAVRLGELATLQQEQLPVTVLVVDDGGYGMLRYDQQAAGDPERGVDLLGPDWVALAQSFGMTAASVASVGEPLARRARRRRRTARPDAAARTRHAPPTAHHVTTLERAGLSSPARVR